jgi:hypothetical protein
LDDSTFLTCASAALRILRIHILVFHSAIPPSF